MPSGHKPLPTKIEMHTNHQTSASTCREAAQFNKKVESIAGGPYTLDGGSYTETIEFVGEGMETYLGKKQPFTIKVDGDKLNQSGQLSDGLKIEEVWQRSR